MLIRGKVGVEARLEDEGEGRGVSDGDTACEINGDRDINGDPDGETVRDALRDGDGDSDGDTALDTDREADRDGDFDGDNNGNNLLVNSSILAASGLVIITRSLRFREDEN